MLSREERIIARSAVRPGNPRHELAPGAWCVSAERRGPGTRRAILLGAIALACSACAGPARSYRQQLRPATDELWGAAESSPSVYAIESRRTPDEVVRAVRTALRKLIRERGGDPLEVRPLDRPERRGERVTGPDVDGLWHLVTAVLGVPGEAASRGILWCGVRLPPSSEAMSVELVWIRPADGEPSASARLVVSRRVVRIEIDLDHRPPRDVWEWATRELGPEGLARNGANLLSIPVRVLLTPVVALGDALELLPLPLGYSSSTDVTAIGALRNPATWVEDLGLTLFIAIPFAYCYGQALLVGPFVDTFHRYGDGEPYRPWVRGLWCDLWF